MMIAYFPLRLKGENRLQEGKSRQPGLNHGFPEFQGVLLLNPVCVSFQSNTIQTKV